VVEVIVEVTVEVTVVLVTAVLMPVVLEPVVVVDWSAAGVVWLTTPTATPSVLSRAAPHEAISTAAAITAAIVANRR